MCFKTGKNQSKTLITNWEIIAKLSHYGLLKHYQGCCLRKFLKVESPSHFLGAQNKICHGQATEVQVEVSEVREDMGGVGVNCGNLGGFQGHRFSIIKCSAKSSGHG